MPEPVQTQTPLFRNDVPQQAPVATGQAVDARTLQYTQYAQQQQQSELLKQQQEAAAVEAARQEQLAQEKWVAGVRAQADARRSAERGAWWSEVALYAVGGAVAGGLAYYLLGGDRKCRTSSKPRQRLSWGKSPSKPRRA
jgi:hypothetical protein